MWFALIILVELFCAGNLCQRVRLPLQHLEGKVSQTLQVSPLDVPSLCRHSKKSAVKFMLYYLRRYDQGNLSLQIQSRYNNLMTKMNSFLVWFSYTIIYYYGIATAPEDFYCDSVKYHAVQKMFAQQANVPQLPIWLVTLHTKWTATFLLKHLLRRSITSSLGK